MVAAVMGTDTEGTFTERGAKEALKKRKHLTTTASSSQDLCDAPAVAPVTAAAVPAAAAAPPLSPLMPPPAVVDFSAMTAGRRAHMAALSAAIEELDE